VGACMHAGGCLRACCLRCWLCSSTPSRRCVRAHACVCVHACVCACMLADVRARMPFIVLTPSTVLPLQQHTKREVCSATLACTCAPYMQTHTQAMCAATHSDIVAYCASPCVAPLRAPPHHVRLQSTAPTSPSPLPPPSTPSQCIHQANNNFDKPWNWMYMSRNPNLDAAAANK